MYVFSFLLILSLARLSVSSVANSKDILSTALEDHSDVKAAEDLANAGVIKEDKPALDLLKKKKTELLQVFTDEKFDARDGDNIANAVATGIKSGLPDLVRGFKTKNWYYMTVGTLNVLTALSVLVGGPYGGIVAALLSIITSVLKIFGEPASESQEAMITRLLKDAQVANLYTEVLGVKMFYETLQSSVKNFRENPTDLTMTEATALYALSFNNINIFGKLQEQIGQFCFTGPVTDANRAEKDINVKRCFKMINGYLRLTALRQMLLAEMAGICQEAVTNQEARHRDSFDKMSKNFVHLIKEDQILDSDVLRFLTTPMESVTARYTIFKLYYAPNDNKEIILYLRRLDITQAVDSKSVAKLFDRKHVMLCSKPTLQGMCQHVMTGYTSGNVARIKNWQKTKSMFIPPGLDVKGKVGKELVGPFRGLAVYSSPDKLVQLQDIKVRSGFSPDADGVRLCTSDEWCDYVEKLDSFQSLGKDSLHGMKLSKIQSLWIPTGFMVILANKDTIAGPIYGEISVNDISKKEWDQILVHKSTDTTVADVVTVCEKEKYEGYCQQLGEEFYKDEPVKFADLKGSISKYEPSDTVERGIYSVEKVLSMKIPAGFSVNLYASKYEKTGATVKSGPYVGPLELSQLGDDGVDMATVKKFTKNPNGKTGEKRHKVHKIQKINSELSNQIEYKVE